jgi:hypothetical protein
LSTTCGERLFDRTRLTCRFTTGGTDVTRRAAE